MLFLIRTQFRRPASLGDDELATLLAAEAQQSRALQEEGTIRHLWREPATEPGMSIAWGVWQAESEAGVRAKLASLPAGYAMEVELREVIVHPNAID